MTLIDLDNSYKFFKEKFLPSDLKKIKINDLVDFCQELRNELTRIVSVTGGHIGPNLGVVELTTALYYVYNFPNDKLIWDIGHQVYVQKMLTGRCDLLKTNRQNGKSPGYPLRSESKFDTVTSSHAGASVSFALGIADSNKIHGNEYSSIAVLGDGSFVEGSVQEAMNHVAVARSKLVIVINDNGRAIEENFGGYHEYFKKQIIGANNTGDAFKSLGFDYRGPFDGHDVKKLVGHFHEIKESCNHPVIVHVKTIKGKGLEKMAENSPMRIHWNHAFNTKTFEKTEKSIFPGGEDNANFVGRAVEKILKKNISAVLITPAVRGNVGLSDVFNNFKEQSIDVSLAEQHSVTLAGGYALSGLKPIVAMESTFMARAYVQIKHDICINNLPLLIIAARSGHGFTDHITHNALEDISYLRTIPNLRIVYPISAVDLERTIEEEYENLSGPTIILFPKANTIEDPLVKFDISENLGIKSPARGSNLILSVGPQNRNAELLQELLFSEGVKFDQVSVKEIYPISRKLRDLIKMSRYIITLEEGILDGGFGSLVLELVNSMQLDTKVLRFGFDKQFVEHGTRAYIYKKYGLDYDSVYKKIKEILPEVFKSNDN